MAELLDWQPAAARDAITARAVEALRKGGLVAFPTETVYGIAANPFAASAVERLVSCKGRPEDKPLSLAIADAEEALRWVPGMSKLARRLTHRVWPGPITLVFDQGLEGGRLAELPADVRHRIAPQGSLGLRVPAHDAILQVLDVLEGPLVLTSANRSGEPDAVSASQVHATLATALDIIIDGGPTHYGRPSSVVRVTTDGWQMLREGVAPARLLSQLTACMVLFVCTGNTCRSPLAAGLCRKLLAERLGCKQEELAERGFVVLSAGLSAMMGMSATAEAIAAAHRLGVDLEGHRSQTLTRALLAQADHVFAMTDSHRQAIDRSLGAIGPRVELLAATNEDIPDPIGGDQQVYDACAERIAACLRERIPSLGE
jgi:protein-tyrosine phosphatase